MPDIIATVYQPSTQHCFPVLVVEYDPTADQFSAYRPSTTWMGVGAWRMARAVADALHIGQRSGVLPNGYRWDCELSPV